MKNKSTLRWIFGCFKRYLPGVAFVSVLGATLSLLTVGVIMVSREIINNAQAGITGDTLRRNIIALCAIVIAEIVLNLVNGYYRARLSAKMDMHLKDRLFCKLICKDYSEITRMHSGDIVNRFASDVDVVVSGVSTIIPTTISIVTKLIAGIGTAIVLDPIVAAVIVVIGFIFPLLGRFMSKKYKHLHKESQRTNGIVRSFLQESVQNIIVIKTFMADNHIRRKLIHYLRSNYLVKMKRSLLSVGTHAGLFGTFSLGYYGVLIWGALGIAAGTLQYGTLFAFMQLVSLLRNPLQNISGLMPQYYASIASAERLIELESIKDEPAPTPANRNELYAKMRAITARNLSFAYDEREVIKDSDFSIKHGSICAVMGESGTGKSTLFRLLLGLYSPTKGTLCLECDDGDITVDSSVRCLFSYVPQGAMVLSGTIRDNITFLSGNVTDEQLENAAKQAVIYDFISSLPDGFDTVIGERGLGLSEGQLQRIAIARALLTDAPVLLLDECTSALDTMTEIKLLENLKNAKDKTVILITHRTAALDICDTVIHVEDCKIS